MCEALSQRWLRKVPADGHTRLDTMVLRLMLLLGWQAAGLAATVELKADERGHFLTRAAIDNTDLDVIIDTGASTVVLSQENAERVGLYPGKLDYAFPVATANGIVKCAAVTLRRVEVGAIL